MAVSAVVREQIIGKQGIQQWSRPSTDPARVPENIEKILRYYFDFPAQKFHIEALEEMFAGGRLLINWPTDHGKSIVTMFFFPILSLMENPNESHILCGANINDSRSRVQTIQAELVSNHELVRDFPHIAKPEEAEGRVWTATQFNVVGRTINNRNPSVYAAGMTAADLKGRRGKMIMDDIESPDVAYSAAKRRQLRDFVDITAERAWENTHDSKRPLLCMIGTPMDVDSIHFHLEDRGWRVLRRPVWTLKPRPNNQFPPIKKYLWEALRTKVDQQYEKLPKRAFSISYLMDPTGGDPNVMSEKEIGQALREELVFPEGVRPRTFVSLDPASGKHRATGADYAGIVVARIHWEAGDELPMVKILEAHKYTQGLFEQVHECAALAARYSSPEEEVPVLYESNSQQGGQYMNAFAHLHPEIRPLRHLTTVENKADKYGLQILRTLVKHKRLVAAPHIHDSEGGRTLRSEIRDLGVIGADDHVAMALWFIVHHAYKTAKYYHYNERRRQSRELSPRLRQRTGGFGFGSPRGRRQPIPSFVDRGV